MNSHQTVVTAKSSDLPLTLAEAKDHLRILSDAQDEYVAALIDAAVDYCEATTGRALRVSHTLTQKYAAWPCVRFELERQPVTSVTSLTYYDASDVSQTVSASDYRLHKSTNAAAYVELDADFVRPTLSVRDDAITVTYTAGYAALADVPARAKHAMKLLIGHWYEHGEAVNIGNITSEVPMATAALLSTLDWGCYR